MSASLRRGSRDRGTPLPSAVISVTAAHQLVSHSSGSVANVENRDDDGADAGAAAAAGEGRNAAPLGDQVFTDVGAFAGAEGDQSAGPDRRSAPSAVSHAVARAARGH